MILAIGGIKGGVGKSTLAVNLACMRALRKDVLFVDADLQASALDFMALRATLAPALPAPTTIQLNGEFVRSEILKQAPKYDDVIIDVGGRDTTSQRAAMAIADLFLIPVMPATFDVWATVTLNTILSEMRQANPKLKAVAVLNQCPARGQDAEDATSALMDPDTYETGIEFSLMKPRIVTRAAIRKAQSAGLGINEFKPVDTKARAEMKAVYKAIF